MVCEKNQSKKFIQELIEITYLIIFTMFKFNRAKFREDFITSFFSNVDSKYRSKITISILAVFNSITNTKLNERLNLTNGHNGRVSIVMEWFWALRSHGLLMNFGWKIMTYSPVTFVVLSFSQKSLFFVLILVI